MQLSNAPPLTQIYQLQVREYLDDDLALWFSPFQMSHKTDGTTILTGTVRDQAELHGLLIKIRDLNLTLLSVISK
jgi:hypothetical protein